MMMVIMLTPLPKAWVALVGVALSILCVLPTCALALDKDLAVVIDPSHPQAYWLAAGTVSHLPIKPIGGLSALPPGNIGWFEFSFVIPSTGWRKLALDGRPHLGAIELEIDASASVVGNEPARSGSLLPGQWVWLRAGEHRLRVIGNKWMGLPQVTSIRLEAPEPGRTNAFRPILDEFQRVSVLGTCPPIKILAGGNNQPAQIDIAFQIEGRALRRGQIHIGPSPEPVVKSVAVPCEHAGDVFAEISLADSGLSEHMVAQASYSVFDVRPVNSGFRKGALVTEIDAVAQAPDFISGDSAIIQGKSGDYRESSRIGATRYVRSQSKIEPSWFAYRVKGLKPGRSYLFEVEYPDDQSRVFVAAYRDPQGVGYPISIAAETGGVWPKSAGMAYRSAIIWPNSSDGRVIIYNIHDQQRAAASRIRFYAIDAEDRPSIRGQPVDGRDVAVWSEEGASFRSLVGNGADETSVFTPVDRYMRLVNSMGATIVSPTVVIYNFELYPSRYNLTFADRDTDLTAAFLLGAQRYGLKVVPELHPRADELLWPARTNEEFEHKLLMSAASSTHYDAPNGVVLRPPYYNALDVDVRVWYRNMVGELADRYKDYPAFAGVQLRISNWQNPALNNLVSLEWGYDAETVSRFFRETELKIPDGMQDEETPEGVKKRHDVILLNYREAWIKWRCEQIRDIFRDIVQRVRQARNDLTVQISFFALDSGGGEQTGLKDLREMGIDIQLLQEVEGLVLVDARFGHGAKEASIEWQHLTREGYRGPNGVKLFENETARPSTLFPMQYIEITGAVAKSQQLGWAVRSREPWISASSEPPGRLLLARYAELVGLFDVHMLGDGGNGYVFSGEGLSEFMAEFRALPRRRFARATNASDTIALRSSDNTVYVVSLSPDPQSINIKMKGVKTLQRLTTGQTVSVLGGVIALNLKPYELIGFRADAEIAELSGFKRDN